MAANAPAESTYLWYHCAVLHGGKHHSHLAGKHSIAEIPCRPRLFAEAQAKGDAIADPIAGEKKLVATEPDLGRGVVVDGVNDRQQGEVQATWRLCPKQDGSYAHECD